MEQFGSLFWDNADIRFSIDLTVEAWASQVVSSIHTHCRAPNVIELPSCFIEKIEIQMDCRSWTCCNIGEEWMQVPSSETATNYTCVRNGLCWKIHNCHSACSASQSPQCLAGLLVTLLFPRSIRDVFLHEFSLVLALQPFMVIFS